MAFDTDKETNIDLKNPEPIAPHKKHSDIQHSGYLSIPKLTSPDIDRGAIFFSLSLPEQALHYEITLTGEIMRAGAKREALTGGQEVTTPEASS